MYKYNPSKQPHHYYRQKVFKEGGRAQYLIISFGTSCPIFEGVPLISLDLNWSCNFSSKLIFQIGAQSIFFFCHWHLFIPYRSSNTTIINLCVNVHIFYGQSHRRFLDRIIRWYAPFYPVHLLQLSLCIMKKNENVLKRVLNHSGWPIYHF